MLVSIPPPHIRNECIPCVYNVFERFFIIPKICETSALSLEYLVVSIAYPLIDDRIAPTPN